LRLIFRWEKGEEGWEKGEEGGRKEERGGRKKKTTPCPPSEYGELRDCILTQNEQFVRFLFYEMMLQHIDQKKNYKRTNNDLQNIHIKLKIE
jgi:NifB/MoaA-like Fe-S oxidoreductase